MTLTSNKLPFKVKVKGTGTVTNPEKR